MNPGYLQLPQQSIVCCVHIYPFMFTCNKDLKQNNKGGSSNDRGGGGSWLTDQSGWMSGWEDKDQEDYVSFDDNDDDNNDDDHDDELG